VPEWGKIHGGVADGTTPVILQPESDTNIAMAMPRMSAQRPICCQLGQEIRKFARNQEPRPSKLSTTLIHHQEAANGSAIKTVHYRQLNIQKFNGISRNKMEKKGSNPEMSDLPPAHERPSSKKLPWNQKISNLH
jgi:hypothetical protein